MAVFALSVTKGITWRGELQEFSNVYHYVTQAGEPFADGIAIDEVVAAERLVHSGDTQFLRARTWGPTSDTAGGGEIQPLNPPSEVQTREIVDLEGFGSAGQTSFWYRELAYLVIWPLGRYGTRNRPQYLRKWLHTNASLETLSDGQAEGSAVLPADIPELTQYMQDVRNVGPIEGYGLCTAQGREPTADGTRYPYLEHRQLGK